MCFGPSVNAASGGLQAGAQQNPPQAYQPAWLGGPFGFGGGRFGGSPWLPFLFNLFSSYGMQQQPQANAGQPWQAAPPTAPPASAPPLAGMTTLTDPLAPPMLPPATAVGTGRDPVVSPPQGNVAPVALSTPMPIAPVARDPFGSSTAPAIPVAGPGANTPLPFRPAFAGLSSPWAGLLGS
jgi:hypothetical protein